MWVSQIFVTAAAAATAASDVAAAATAATTTAAATADAAAAASVHVKQAMKMAKMILCPHLLPLIADFCTRILLLVQESEG